MSNTHFTGPIAYKEVSGDSVFSDHILEGFVDVKITSAQVLALNATPQTIVAAPGAGKALIFRGAVLHKPAGTAYAGVAAGEDLSMKYTGTSGLEVGVCEVTGFLDQTTAQTRFMSPSIATATGGAGINTSVTPVANAILCLHMLTGEIITGNSVLYVRAYYRVIPATFSY